MPVRQPSLALDLDGLAPAGAQQGVTGLARGGLVWSWFTNTYAQFLILFQRFLRIHAHDCFITSSSPEYVIYGLGWVGLGRANLA